jgi:precorrin-6B methylase 2
VTHKAPDTIHTAAHPVPPDAASPPPGTTGPPRQWADPRSLQIHRDQPPRDVPYLPTEEPVVAAMLRFANVTENDVLYDLGCGDGRICIAAARRGARAVGVDIDLLRIRECLENATRAHVRDRVQFLRQSFFDTDLRPATVVMLYLLSNINVRLRPKLLWELRPGSRLVINHFDIGDWKPDATLNAHHRELSLFIIPAWVQGIWKCVVNHPDGRRRMTLRLHRHYQHAWGTARLTRREVPLSDVTLVGQRLSFTVFHPQFARRPTRFTCCVEGAYLRGSCHAIGEEAFPTAWGGVRDP